MSRTTCSLCPSARSQGEGPALGLVPLPLLQTTQRMNRVAYLLDELQRSCLLAPANGRTTARFGRSAVAETEPSARVVVYAGARIVTVPRYPETPLVTG